MLVRIVAVLLFTLMCGCVLASEDSRGTSISSTETTLPDSADGAFVSQVGARNLTPEFNQRFCNPNPLADAQSLKAFEGCDILIVHGWLGEVAIRLTSGLDKLNCDQRILDYLKDQRRAIDELGLCSIAPPYRSESVCACGDKVAAMIASHPRRVIIISHSKGCLDTLDALIKLQRSGQLNKVAGWISMQGPLYGAEGAAKFMRPSNVMGKLRIRMLGAKIEGVDDMTPCARKDYMALNQSEIDTVVHSVPVICFASWTTPACATEDLTDGHVTPESAILPGADYIAKCGINHSMPVLGRKKTPYDRVTFTKTLLAMLGDRISERPRQ